MALLLHKRMASHSLIGNAVPCSERNIICEPGLRMKGEGQVIVGDLALPVLRVMVPGKEHRKRVAAYVDSSSPPGGESEVTMLWKAQCDQAVLGVATQRLNGGSMQGVGRRTTLPAFIEQGANYVRDSPVILHV